MTALYILATLAVFVGVALSFLVGYAVAWFCGKKRE